MELENIVVLARKYPTKLDLEYPSARISYSFHSDKRMILELFLHTSEIVNGPKHDIKVSFDGPAAFQWEEESFGQIQLPQNCPKCLNENFRNYVFPILTIENSQWAKRYSDVFDGPKFVHYAFVSLNDLVHVISAAPPKVRKTGARKQVQQTPFPVQTYDP